MRSTLVLIGIAAILLFCLLCYVCFRIACVRSQNVDRTRDAIPEGSPLFPYRDRFLAAGEMLDGLETQGWDIESFDGLRLHGEFFDANSEKTIILMHGYRSHWRGDFGIALPFYRSLGFNVLLCDQRCHGKSEGRYITYGVHEKYDCRDWILEVIRRRGKDCQIFLSGMSMGAATVLLATELKLPSQVKGIIADCGFTSGYDIVKLTTKGINRHIPMFVVDCINFCCRLFAGFDLKEGNTQTAMKVCDKPILFIHGTHDTFVPCEMTLRNYDACVSRKELLTVRGAEHGMSYLLEEEHCKEVLKNFLEKCL